MKYLKAIVLFFLTVLSINFASANFVAKVNSDNNSIFPWEEASFVLTVQNKDNIPNTLIYEFPDSVEWSLITDPLYIERDIDSNETLTTLIRAKPRNGNIIPRQYNLDVKVISKKTGETEIKTLSIFIKDKRYAEYLPNINTVIVLPESLDPRNDATLSINIKNLVPLNISDYTIEVRSEINPLNNQKIALPLNSLESAKTQFVLKYDDFQEPATDHITLIASIPSKNYSVDHIIKDIRLLPYSKINQEIFVEKSFLKTITKVSFYNDGNIVVDAPYKIQTSFLHKMFISSDPKESAYLKESGYSYLGWDNKIKPRETVNIIITVDYRPFFIWIIIIIILIAVYFILRSPIIIKKETKKFGKGTAEDGLSRIKVLIHLKNRTGKIINDIVLLDRVPHIGTVEKEYAVGTMQPTNITRLDSKSTIIKWQIESLEPYEERIITYIIDAKLIVIGSMTLSHATLKYKNRRGGMSKISSNSVIVE